MNKAELIADLAKTTGRSQATTLDILDALARRAAIEMSKGEDFTVPGICKLTVATRAARTGRNPSTGAAVEIPACKVVKIKALAQIKAAVGAK